MLLQLSHSPPPSLNSPIRAQINQEGQTQSGREPGRQSGG